MNEDQIKAYELGRLINTFGVWYKTNLFKSINDLNNFAKTLLENTFGYIRSCMISSNKKYADMLRRGLKKGIIKRQKVDSEFARSLGYNGNTKFLYYV